MLLASSVAPNWQEIKRLTVTTETLSEHMTDPARLLFCWKRVLVKYKHSFELSNDSVWLISGLSGLMEAEECLIWTHWSDMASVSHLSCVRAIQKIKKVLLQVKKLEKLINILVKVRSFHCYVLILIFSHHLVLFCRKTAFVRLWCLLSL